MRNKIDWVLTKPVFILKSEIFNWFWRNKNKRKQVKEIAKSQRVLSYLNRYAAYFSTISPDKDAIPKQEKERIFSIWLQGEENAPPIVKVCFASIRKNCTQDFVVLDEKTLFDWIQLPDYVVTKWKKGKIHPAHFTDICRLELLYQYGGIWADATDFIAAPFPYWLLNTDFFVYHTGDNIDFIGFYSFIQNCFIRAKKNNFLVKAWRDAVLLYWKEEEKVRDYFVHQLIFKKLVETNILAKELYTKMPYIVQDTTHVLWFKHAENPFDEKLFNEITQNAIFQKTEYRSLSSKNPISGSFAEMMINKYGTDK